MASSGGPASVYEAAGFMRAAGDDQFPVYRRELAGEVEVGWEDLLSKARPPDEGDAWPLPCPRDRARRTSFGSRPSRAGRTRSAMTDR